MALRAGAKRVVAEALKMYEELLAMQHEFDKTLPGMTASELSARGRVTNARLSAIQEAYHELDV